MSKFVAHAKSVYDDTKLAYAVSAIIDYELVELVWIYFRYEATVAFSIVALEAFVTMDGAWLAV